ncbi:MAG: LysR family transcriptional regulator [Rhizobium sp. 63-7]|nr:MAG: LysR family transcriptional regulator [Rhizobium sp. 63-7]
MDFDIRLKDIRYLIAAAEYGSFRKAGAAIGVHESSVSRRIRDLEDQLGAALFVRYPTGVSLTDAGRSFVARARRALGQIHRARQDAGSFGRGEAGVIRFGVFSSFASGFIRELLDQYLNDNAGIRAEVTEAGPAAHLAAVQRHDLDVAFLTGAHRVDGCDSQFLWNERVVVALPRSDKLSGKREVNWRDLQGRRFIITESDPGPEIYDYIVKHLADLGRHPTIERHNVGRDNLMSLVAIGQGLTLVSEAAKGARFRGVVYPPIRGAVLPFSAIWSVKNDNPALRRFLSLARKMSRSALACVMAVGGIPI